MLHAVYSRVQIATEVQVKVNGEEISGDVNIYTGRGTRITIEMNKYFDNFRSEVDIEFTDEGRILAVVGDCTQFEIFSEKDSIDCRSNQLTQSDFCFCNRLSADTPDCNSIGNPIVTECVYPNTSDSPSPFFPQFELFIYSNTLETAYYKLSWTQDEIGSYLFRKEKERVEIVGATEFHTIDVNNPPGLIHQDNFTLDIGNWMVISLPIFDGELFVMQLLTRQDGIHFYYLGCPLLLISSNPTTLHCVTGYINNGWKFKICPNGIREEPVQFEMCAIRISPQTFHFDVITELNSAFPYYGMARMDLQLFWNEQRPDYFDFSIRNYNKIGDVKFTVNGVEYTPASSSVMTIGNLIPIEFLIHGKEIFKFDLDLNSPIVSVIARNCEQFKLNEDICRGELSLFYSFKFCANSDLLRTHSILSCSDRTEGPPITLPTGIPYETYKMYFSFTKESRTLKGFIVENYKEEDGEILERSLVFHWTVDTIPTPFPFSISFNTIHFQVDSTLPSYPYPIPFQVDSPIFFSVIDSFSSVLFRFSVVVGEKSTQIVYEECDQFSIDGEEQGCYGTSDSYLCVGEDADLFPRLPFKVCAYPTTPPPLTDLRAFYIYKEGQIIFTWDLMLSKNDETGGWIVEASQAGSRNIEGQVMRGMDSVSTLTFEIEVGELTRFGVRDRISGVIIDSFSILPSTRDVIVLYNDCTQFIMGEGEEVECFYVMDTRVCTAEPSRETNQIPIRACENMRINLFDDQSLLSWSNDKYQHEFTVIPSKRTANQTEIWIDDEKIDSYHWIAIDLQLITVLLSPQDSFSLLPLSTNTSVIFDNCLQFQLGFIDGCYSNNNLSLCPQHDPDFTQSFDTQWHFFLSHSIQSFII
ncbi:hypothetical protein PFISCL1PPCAC_15739 [Pristionchus fissidentatus]|uniref:Uncharacterized protein n=1 Tax=Pristionchus fissidentatus TaxID=1538716 RepID=A0AAV5VXU6_9BILA|nr:hypothetical protein PFISCL1PPCAC_15739 [Pristionchus fissidentatus]